MLPNNLCSVDKDTSYYPAEMDFICSFIKVSTYYTAEEWLWINKVTTWPQHWQKCALTILMDLLLLRFVKFDVYWINSALFFFVRLKPCIRLIIHKPLQLIVQFIKFVMWFSGLYIGSFPEADILLFILCILHYSKCGLRAEYSIWLNWNSCLTFLVTCFWILPKQALNHYGLVSAYSS